jgi:hypothetical protein
MDKASWANGPRNLQHIDASHQNALSDELHKKIRWKIGTI